MAGKALEALAAWQADSQPLTPHEFAIAAMLAHHINPQKRGATVRVKALMSEAKVSRRDIAFKALAKLEAAGLITRRSSIGRTTTYTWMRWKTPANPSTEGDQVTERDQVTEGNTTRSPRGTRPGHRGEHRTSNRNKKKEQAPLKAPQGASAADATQDTLIPADAFDTEASSNEPTGSSKAAKAAETKWPDRYSDCPEFLEWYHVYPLKKDPKRAYKAWQTALKDGATREELLAAIGPYREECERLGRPFKYPATWLNAGSWADEPTTGPAPGQSLQRSPGLGDVWDTLAAFAAGDADQPTHSPHMRLIEGGFHDQPDGCGEAPRWPMCGP